MRTSIHPIVLPRLTTAALSAIAQAAALAAWADGRIHHEERRGLLRFLRSQGLLQTIGRSAASQAFEAALEQDATPDEALEQLSRHRGTAAAPLIAKAASYVAFADGNAHPAELDLLHRLQRRLGLEGALA